MKSYLISLTSLALLATLLLTACSGNDEPVAQGQSVTLTVPIELVVSNPLVPGTRATGDPGLDDELPPPAQLYVFAWVLNAEDRYTLLYTHRDLQTKDWTYTLGTNGEDASARYRLNEKLVIPAKLTIKSSNNNEQVGRIFAIATNKALTADQLSTIAGSYSSVVTATPVSDNISSVIFDSSPNATLAQSTLPLADWTSNDLRDLYTNPYEDPNEDNQGVGNGYVVYDSTFPYKIRCGTVRLYHCAAKVDFTWEMDASLRQTESVASITVKNLPTSCKLFMPTANPEGTATQSIATTIETQWIGREYRYMLQPPTGIINYDVGFSGSRTDVSNAAFNPVSVNGVFTGWYRIVATVK